MKFKKGDKVHVIRSAKQGEQGWDNTWEKEMNRSIGNELTVIKDYENDPSGSGVHLNDGWCYPAHVLQLVGNSVAEIDIF